MIGSIAHRHGDGDARQDRGRSHRSESRRHHGRRSGRRRRQPADRPRAVDPRQEDRHHPRHRLWRGQEAGRHFRRRSVLRHFAAGGRDRRIHRRRHPGVVGQRPHHAERHRVGRRDARQGGADRAAVRSRSDQRGAGRCSRSRSCWRCASSRPIARPAANSACSGTCSATRRSPMSARGLPAAQLPITQPGGAFQQPASPAPASAAPMSADRRRRFRRSSPPACCRARRRSASWSVSLTNRLQIAVNALETARAPRAALPSPIWWRCRAIPRASLPAANFRFRSRARSAPSRSTTRNTASALPSRRPCSMAA